MVGLETLGIGWSMHQSRPPSQAARYRPVSVTNPATALPMTPSAHDMTSLFLRHFKCAAGVSAPSVLGTLSRDPGYFTYDGVTCYGRCAGVSPAPEMSATVPDVRAALVSAPGSQLPFDLNEVVANLQQERYRKHRPNRVEALTTAAAARYAYYLLRPLLPVQVRKHLQRIRLSGWDTIAFPAWPVDLSVEALMRATMAHVLRSQGLRRVPFIWFWPEGAPSCAVMTHDIEGVQGQAFCPDLMAIDESFGIRSSFQVVPEGEFRTPLSLVDTLRARGFEVNIHDLNHDGSLFKDRAGFADRAAAINRHAREIGCLGFRSGAMYREQGWYDAFEVSYDMSVPNVAHLEPQRGGCCTVTPYFIGKILELPLTTIQDYSLFHILNDYSTTLWEKQIDIIRSEHGLISFITHPDYLAEKRARTVYVNLLRHLDRMRSTDNLWIALPAEVDEWWRARQQMSLVERGGTQYVAGPGSERARVAYATFENDQVVYELDRASR